MSKEVTKITKALINKTCISCLQVCKQPANVIIMICPDRTTKEAKK